MKILYAIQGTGNGHLARATEIIPILKEMGEIDILVSGIQSDIELPFKVKYKLNGFSFIFGKNGGVDIWKTILKARLFRLIKDIRIIPVDDYDLVINDFEPVTAWACKLWRKECIGVSHQNAVLHTGAAKPKKNDLLGKWILKYYAPSSVKYGFHFKQLDENVFTPVIRSSIRNAVPGNKGHYTVYLPAFNDQKILEILDPFRQYTWQVFSKYCTMPYKARNIHFNPVSLEAFNKSFVNCSGVICTAGFETPAEALFMGKKLCVVPMKNQYEQACNAAMLAEMGVTVVEKSSQFHDKISLWLSEETNIRIAYPDCTREIFFSLIQKYEVQRDPGPLNFILRIRKRFNWPEVSIPVSSRLRQRHL